jgi:cyclopropane fatty-acyl-phospholipid synthase-like methyltransferase
MAAPAKKITSKAAPKGKAGKNNASLGQKIHAWWEGYDVDAMLALTKTAPEAAIETKAAPSARTAGNAELPFDPWSADRTDVAQLIWGKGFCGPGGPDYIIGMSKLLALTPEMSIADLGACLGGAARVLAEHFGVWVTGFETSEHLVKAGNEISYMAGMSRKAPLKHLDIYTKEPFERRFDRIYGHGFLSKLQQLSDMTSKVAAALKDDGLMLVTDYFVRDKKTLADPEVIEWLATEPHSPHLHTVENVLKEFDAKKLLVRVNEPITDQYSKLVTAGWKSANHVVSELMAEEDTARLVPVLLREAEIWTRRLKMFSSGKVEVRRILAAKVI